MTRDSPLQDLINRKYPVHTYEIFLKKWHDINKDASTRKQTVIDTISKARVDQIVYQFFIGMKDAFLDEMESILSLVLLPIQSFSYILTIAKMIAQYVTGKEVEQLQPLLQDMRRSIESVLGQFPIHLVSFIEHNGIEEMKNKLLGMLRDYVRQDSTQIAYDIGYFIVSFISPKKTKLMTMLDDVAKKAMKQIRIVQYGDHVKIGNKKKKLEPNIKYTCPHGYTYTTDHLGRITHVEGDLKLEQGTRNNKDQKDSRKACTDHGGHLIACRFGGSGDIDNLVSMDAKLNQGKYRALENDWAKSLKEGKTVKVKITPIYEGDDPRPVRFEIEHKTGDGGWIEEELENKAGG